MKIKPLPPFNGNFDYKQFLLIKYKSIQVLFSCLYFRMGGISVYFFLFYWLLFPFNFLSILFLPQISSQVIVQIFLFVYQHIDPL